MTSKPTWVVVPPAKSGRPHLDGSPPGEGTYTKSYSVTLPPDVHTYLKALGGGNFSRGVRIVTRFHQEHSA